MEHAVSENTARKAKFVGAFLGVILRYLFAAFVMYSIAYGIPYDLVYEKVKFLRDFSGIHPNFFRFTVNLYIHYSPVLIIANVIRLLINRMAKIKQISKHSELHPIDSKNNLK